MSIDKNEKISVYGGFGFVLGEFCNQFKDQVIRIEKHEIEPQSPIILYGISTVDNYNVFDSPTLDIETNLVHFMEVLDACHRKYKKNFEFNLVSSWFVYGLPSSEDKPLVEESLCDPRGFYSITARAREQLLISYCETFGIQYRIFRLANVIGSKDKKVSKKKNALQYLLDRVVRNEPIELYDNGEFYRDYIDVRDVAQAIKLAMSSQAHRIINISNGKSYKFRDLIEFAVSYSGSKSFIGDKLDKPEFHSVVQSKDVFLSNNKLKELGYKPKFIVWKSIQDIVDEYKR